MEPMDNLVYLPHTSTGWVVSLTEKKPIRHNLHLICFIVKEYSINSITDPVRFSKSMPFKTHGVQVFQTWLSKYLHKKII